MNTYRFIYNYGECGGIVMAFSEDGAYEKVKEYLVGCCYTESLTDLKEEMKKDGELLVLWPWFRDKYYENEFPDVINCDGY